MNEKSEQSTTPSRADQLHQLQERCEKVYGKCDQHHQNFYRLLYALDNDGEEKFYSYGQDYIALFTMAMQVITGKKMAFSEEQLIDQIEQTVLCLEKLAVQRPTERTISLPATPTKPSDSEIDIERPKSAPSNRSSHYSPGRNSRSNSSTATSRSNESSPRRFLGGLFSPKSKKKGGKKGSSPNHKTKHNLK